MYLVIAFSGFVLLALVGILDKSILQKTLHRPVLFVFYSTIFVLPILLLAPFGAGVLATGLHWFLAAVSGVAFGLALWATYIAIHESEVSHAGPLIGAATPFFVLILSRYFLGEVVTFRQQIGIAVLIVGSLLIALEKSRRHNGWHRGMLWGILAGLAFAISHVTAKYIYDLYGFYTGFVYTRGAMGLFGAALLLWPGVLTALRRKKPAVIAAQHLPRASDPGAGKFLIIVVDKVLGVIGVILVQYATAIGSVSLVNALNGVQYAVLVVLVAIFSKFYPKLFKETYSRHELAQEIMAIALIITGVGLLV